MQVFLIVLVLLTCVILGIVFVMSSVHETDKRSETLVAQELGLQPDGDDPWKLSQTSPKPGTDFLHKLHRTWTGKIYDWDVAMGRDLYAGWRGQQPINNDVAYLAMPANLHAAWIRGERFGGNKSSEEVLRSLELTSAIEFGVVPVSGKHGKLGYLVIRYQREPTAEEVRSIVAALVLATEHREPEKLVAEEPEAPERVLAGYAPQGVMTFDHVEDEDAPGVSEPMAEARDESGITINQTSRPASEPPGGDDEPQARRTPPPTGPSNSGFSTAEDVRRRRQEAESSSTHQPDQSAKNVRPVRRKPQPFNLDTYRGAGDDEEEFPTATAVKPGGGQTSGTSSLSTGPSTGPSTPVSNPSDELPWRL